MKPLISIIIPVYNVENCLIRCISSLIHQTYENIEIILIDDGSSDKCPQICDEYSKTDSRIKVVHKQNGGVSSARNLGIDVCNGEYISFIDADDWIDKNFIETMYHEVVLNNYDLVQCNCIMVDEWGKQKESVYKQSEQIIRGYNDIMIGFFYRFISPSACDKLFKRNLISSIRFKEELSIGEDAKFVFDYCTVCENVKIMSLELYYYFQRSDSVMHESFNKKHFNTLQIIDEYLEVLKDNETIYPYCVKKDVYASMNLIKLISKENKFRKQRKILRKRILRYSKIVLFSQMPVKYTKKIKVFILMLKVCPGIAYHFLKIY